MPPPDNPDASPKFIAPGVYIEEIPSRTRPITGVATSITAFVGLASDGPVNQVSEPFASYTDFKASYGDASLITLADQTQVRNYLALAVQAFFENGGTKLYISRVTAADGTNSAQPVADDYGRALKLLEPITEIAIVAAPGATVANASGIASVTPVHAALIAHAERQSAYRFAVLDPPQGCSVADVQSLRAQYDTRSAALYYPWVNVPDPSPAAGAGAQISLPPSGFLCGIYAQNDNARGVFKAPANIAIKGAIGFETTINDQINDVLNPLGINCLRSFPGRGNLVWGARTLSSDPEWKYVNVSRYLLYLEQSIDEGTQWAVFEPNAQNLWTAVQSSVSSFLYNEWRSGALLGTKPEQAYLVKCDRTTMTQNDIDNGQLICLVGVAVIQPAEFVIFQISQLTKLPGS
ncbi:MAG: phage tail sheath subtilisin-like domain-containing protein [Edaphobacter sp.]|uniref:phage tail sheath C-terminal domain-containing protein n=1 Tax=Edaphobacter sp. TaxID=1934404 RepID=UPI0023A466EE|nr:phage tail sheath C-terminal domain-containing protein [Edaphobacter sp.]MDE1176401.1 phage tail sheath subtilisin-like domain-containing protein [Edaphobacter sp.]